MFGARGIPSTYGGYETFLTVLLPELVARGHRVTIYCRRGYNDGGDYRGVRRVSLRCLDTKQLGTLSHGLAAAARARPAGHDVVFVVNVANALFALAARATGQRIVLNTDGQEWRREKWGALGRAYFLASAHIARFGASALVSDCEGMREIYEERFASSSTVIPYCWTGIDEDARPELLQSFGVRPRSYFLVAGRLVPENNIERIVEAYASAMVETPMLVLGTANYASPVERRLRQIAAEVPRVILAGHVVDRKAYATVVGEAKAYFHAHSVGGINPSLIEAMGCGARVVALSTVFNREALANCGSYFRDFEEELPEVMRGLDMSDPDGDEHVRKAARERALEVYGLDEVTDAYERLFRAVAGQRRSASTTMETRWRCDEKRELLRCDEERTERERA